jgi:hypothetical protein
MITCLNSRGFGVSKELRFGGCSKCGGRKFADTVELWVDKLGWVALISIGIYVPSSVALWLISRAKTLYLGVGASREAGKTKGNE